MSNNFPDSVQKKAVSSTPVSLPVRHNVQSFVSGEKCFARNEECSARNEECFAGNEVKAESRSGLSFNPSKTEFLLLASGQVENAIKEQSEAGFFIENSDASVTVFLYSQFDALESKQWLSQSQDSWIAALPHSPKKLSDACKLVLNALLPQTFLQ